MTGGPWRPPGTDVDTPHRYTSVTRLHVGAADASEGLSMAVESYGARHGMELLERVGAACAVWFRRGGRLVLARQVGAVAGADDVPALFERPLADIFADLRRIGGSVEVPARLPDGSLWRARFVPLPEGAVAAVWVEAQASGSMPAADPAPVTESATPDVPLDLGMPRRLMSIAAKVGGLADGKGHVRERVVLLQRALDREAWRLLGERGVGLPVDPRKVPLTAKLESIQQRVEALTPDTVETTWDIPPGLARVAVPGPAVRFLLEELVRNSVAGMGPDGGRLRVRAGALELAQDVLWHGRPVAAGSYAFVEVTDNGAGIPTDRVEQLARGEIPGSLQAVRGLVLGWGGAVRIRSALGRGTIVQVAMPAIGVQRAEAAPAVAAPSEPSRRAAIVVMPAGERRTAVVSGLEESGLDVLVARDASEATDRFRDRSGRGGVALLAVAHELPDGGGFELARRLREMAPVLPVVLMTDEPVDEVEEDLPDLAPGRVVPMQYAQRMAVGAARLLLPRVRTTPG